MYQNLPVLFSYVLILRPTPEKIIHREIVSNFFPSKSNKTMANEICCVSLAQEINKLSRIICFHGERGMESLQMNDFTTKISFYADEIYHYRYFTANIQFDILLLCINHNCYLHMPSWGPDLVNKLISISISWSQVLIIIIYYEFSLLHIFSLVIQPLMSAYIRKTDRVYMYIFGLPHLGPKKQ